MIWRFARKPRNATIGYLSGRARAHFGTPSVRACTTHCNGSACAAMMTAYNWVMTTLTPEQRFERELEVFRTEQETGAQFFYAYLAVHAVAYENKSVEAMLNTAPLFWNTCLGA